MTIHPFAMNHLKHATVDCVEQAIDPMAVARIDIVDGDEGGATVFIWMHGPSERLVIMFGDRGDAVDYVRAIWEDRQSARWSYDDAD